jgi:hypothetical protein
MIHNEYIDKQEGNLQQWGARPEEFRDPRAEAQLHRD